MIKWGLVGGAESSRRTGFEDKYENNSRIENNNKRGEMKGFF